jgi:motility quorum-sensing regulator/GCU-specific mRNA interferase toxin
MEKATPHCKLPIVKAMVLAGKVRSTMTALSGAAALGYDFAGMVEIVAALTMGDFYKSMTTLPIIKSGKTCIAFQLRPGRYI